VTYATSALARQTDASSGPEVTETIASQATAEIYSGHPVASYTGLYLIGGNLVDGFFYDLSALDPFLANPTTYFASHKIPGGPLVDDPVAWALALTERYGYYTSVVPANATWVYVPPNPSVYLNDFIRDQGRRVKRAYVLELFDPTMLNGLYGLARYIASGDPFFRPLMVGTSQFRVAPPISADLGYLGAENYFELFVLTGDLPPFDVYYRTGGNMVAAQRGVGLEVRDIHVGDRLLVRGQLDGWYDGLAKSVGGNLEQNVTWRVTRQVGITEALGLQEPRRSARQAHRRGAYGYIGLRLYWPDAPGSESMH
jgi:hypothetical protein